MQESKWPLGWAGLAGKCPYNCYYLFNELRQPQESHSLAKAASKVNCEYRAVTASRRQGARISE